MGWPIYADEDSLLICRCVSHIDFDIFFMNIYRCFTVLLVKLNLYFSLRNLVHDFKKKIWNLKMNCSLSSLNYLVFSGLLGSVDYDLCCLEFKETLLLQNSFLYVWTHRSLWSLRGTLHNRILFNKLLAEALLIWIWSSSEHVGCGVNESSPI